MQIITGRRVRSAATVLALATAALLGTAGSALACHSDDDRPTPIPGKISKCEEVRAGGKALSDADFKFTGGKGQRTLDITGVGEGVKVTAIVVLGGDDGYNVYEPGKRKLGKTPPWTELRAPLNRNGSKANIDKWYACGEKTKPTEPTKPSEPTKTSTAKPPTTAPTSTTEKPSDTPTSTTAPAPNVGGNGGNGGGLADTGFDNAWLLWAGGLLVLAGAGVLVLLRVRRKTN
ncbi:LPXTG cell wall anchor domain-containing protein [Amycolatopsis pittospori]|uniref:LPXTG cell wall anchor domain-containing protein n=1 Tax=Amycolatopsis pittospori TaxID=2749434 RepID=UPI0015F02D40|nr:LPXTG cell wall anchor domain-containing protein [Amycolatopsis pittospori]